MEQEQIDRYKLVVDTGVCPDCGQDVKKVTLGEVLKNIQAKPESDEDPEAIAYRCTHKDCGYAITLGLREEPAVQAATGT